MSTIKGHHPFSCQSKKYSFDNPLDPDGVNYQVPSTPVVSAPDSVVAFGTEYLITWKADRARSYTVQEALNNSFSNPVSSSIDSSRIGFYHQVVTPTKYYYRVMAYNGDYKSAWSNVINVYVNPVLPEAPRDLKASDVTATTFTLQWTDTSDNEQDFKIERKEVGGAFTEIAGVVANTTVYQVKVLLPGVSYNFRIRAYNITGYSDYTAEISIRTKNIFTISGALGVTVTLSGDKSETQTVSSDGGTYSFSVEEGGSYTVIPAKTGYVFAPVSQSITNVTANKNQNFTVSKQIFTISGKIMGADRVTVTLSGDATGTQTVNNGDLYTFSVEYGGNYTVTPVKTGYTFTPSNKTFTSVISYQSQDFMYSPWNNVGIKYASIPAGSFSMGQVGIAEPVHTVTLSGFEMSVYEITQGQYIAVIGSNPSYFTGDDNLPVETVSWWDAIKFCNALSTNAGLSKCYDESLGSCDFTKNGFRLPTEAEWEYACRAGSTTDYNLGDAVSDLGRAAWYGVGNEHPVGQKTANAWGLYDMHGNVWELCNDWYGDYTAGYQTNPLGAQISSNRVLRGGSWVDGNFNFLRSAFRTVYTPTDNGQRVGFRVVRRP